MNKEYYILDDGQPLGPFTYNELVQQPLALDTQVSVTGGNQWLDAVDLPELAGYFQSQGISIVTEDSFASFWMRLGAYLVDCIVFFVLIMIGAVIYAVTHPGLVVNYNDIQKNQDTINIIGQVTLILYNAILEATPLQGSLGKWVYGLRVVDESGGRLNFGRAVFRNAGKILSELLFGLGYLYIFFNPYKQALHDTLAKTYVIRKPDLVR